MNARQASGEPSEEHEHEHHHHHHYHHHHHHHYHHHHTHGHDDSDEMYDDEDDNEPDERLRQARANAEAALGQDPDAVIDALMDEVPLEENDEELAPDPEGASQEEYIHNTCNGVCDIIATGEVRPPFLPASQHPLEADGRHEPGKQTLERHGQAWHFYRFYGRIRKWDGLIALVRVPVEDRGLGIFIFRGYLVGGQNLTGSWRAYASNPNAIPLEGPFIASKRADA